MKQTDENKTLRGTNRIYLSTGVYDKDARQAAIRDILKERKPELDYIRTPDYLIVDSYTINENHLLMSPDRFKRCVVEFLYD